jgi:hypothetical protein
MRPSGRGLGPGNREFFWALLNGIELIGECHLGPTKHEIHSSGIVGELVVPSANQSIYVLRFLNLSNVFLLITSTILLFSSIILIKFYHITKVMLFFLIVVYQLKEEKRSEWYVVFSSFFVGGRFYCLVTVLLWLFYWSTCFTSQEDYCILCTLDGNKLRLLELRHISGPMPFFAVHSQDDPQK